VAYDVELADRIRELLLFSPDVSEKRMFGGVSFLIGGHIAVAVSGSGGLLLRAQGDEWEELLAQPHVGPFVMRGRELRGRLRVSEDAVTEDEDLKHWVETGVDLARALPPSA
jgi:TfoX/Sxy family transcriptional regulator of competence genes